MVKVQTNACRSIIRALFMNGTITGLKTLKFRDFYPNRFGQFLSEIGTTSPNQIFVQILD